MAIERKVALQKAWPTWLAELRADLRKLQVSLQIVVPHPMHETDDHPAGRGFPQLPKFISRMPQTSVFPISHQCMLHMCVPPWPWRPHTRVHSSLGQEHIQYDLGYIPDQPIDLWTHMRYRTCSSCSRQSCTTYFKHASYCRDLP